MSVEKSIERGYMQLMDADYEAALVTAEKLIAKRVHEGHEIKTNALVQMNRLEEAIAVAEEAMTIWPSQWTLYNNLGMALLAAERNREAMLAFRQAESFDEAGGPELSLNIAVAALASEDFDEALEALTGNEDWGEFELPRVSLQIGAMVAAERWADLLRFGDGIVEELGEDLEEIYGPGLTASIHGARALATLHGKQQPRRALNLAWDALRISPTEDLALTTVRECTGKESETAEVYALVCEVDVPEEESFANNYVVAADSLPEAMEYVTEFEAQVSGGVPRLIVHQVAGPAEEVYCGILEIVDLDEDGEGEYDDIEDDDEDPLRN